MGERIRAKDWSATPLGPVEQWPQSLKTIVRIMLTSRQPIWIGWGPELVKLYNDPYKAIVGGKHPDALGQPASLVWREIWDVVGPRLQTTVEHDRGTYDEALLLIMERHGYPEETYYTFSYSPVPGDDGGVGGIICANTDDTRRIIGERQVKLLHMLAAETADAHTVEEACRLSLVNLAHNPHDIPFAMLYLLDQATQTVWLAGTTGIAEAHEAVPRSVALDAPGTWPFATVLREQKVEILANLDDLFETLPTGAWQRSPHQVVIAPIAPAGQMGKAGVLVVGLNPFRRFDESYQGFIDLIAGQIAASIGNAQAYEGERKRAEALAEIDRAKTLFFSNVSHELRTPLTLMLGPIEDTLAEADTLAPDLREGMEILHRNALRLLKLVNTLLDFSRIEAGRAQALYEPTDLATLTADLASNFRAVIEKAGMHLRVDCPPLDEAVYVDREMWEKIILNLLSNAFKYTLAGEIAVTLQRQGNSVELSVADTGVGISAEELPHMFERFHRIAGSAGRTFEGTGIGLSLVQELVKLHGGTISVTSTHGQGSTFTVSLPLGMAHLPQGRIATRSTRASTALNEQIYVNEAFRLLAGQEAVIDTPPNALRVSDDGQSSGETQKARARILFADDNADMRDYLKRLLQSHYTVQTVADGQAALAALEEFHPDLILTDVMMPKMDGIELLQALRANAQTKTLPVILLSARAGEEASIEGLQIGADDYLVKPFSARELLARIAAHLEIARLHRVTEHKINAERERVEESEARFRTLADNISQFAWMADETGWTFWYNQRWYEYTGKNPQEMQDERWRNILHPDHRARVGQKMRHCLSTGEVWEDTFPLRGKDGTYRWFLSSAIPIRDEQGKVIRWFGTNTDITEQKRIEQKRGEFIGIASHELKTPVTSVKGYAQILERRFRQAGDERSAELLGRMDRQLDKLTSLINDLLDVTKIESENLLFHLSTFDYNELIAEIIEETQRTTTRHRIVLDLAATITLVADRDRIGQVLTNLLTNAIKYSPSADIIRVKTILADGAVITSVQDEGIGIPQEKQAHIFERFFRVEGETQITYPGLGLGLYISAEFVKRHHGSIWVESEEGKGTTFFFSLPLTHIIAEQNEIFDEG